MLYEIGHRDVNCMYLRTVVLSRIIEDYRNGFELHETNMANCQAYLIIDIRFPRRIMGLRWENYEESSHKNNFENAILTGVSK